MVAYFESLSSKGFPLTDSPRARCLRSDKAGEFTAPFSEKFLSRRKGIYRTMTAGYDPQADCTAERTVGLIKALSARCLSSSGLGGEYWSYAVRYAAQSLICVALQKAQRSPPFGSQVIAQALGHSNTKYAARRSISGRLMFWGHLSDQGSYILCPPDTESDESLAYKAGLPILSPLDAPEAIPPDVVTKGADKEGEHPKDSFDKSMGGTDPDIRDLDEDDDDFLLSAELPGDDTQAGYYSHQLRF